MTSPQPPAPGTPGPRPASDSTEIARLSARWRELRVRWTGLGRGRRWTVRAGLVLVVVLVVATTAAIVLVRTPLPRTTGSAGLSGLEGDVEVLRDEHGIPQLYGDSLEDLVRAQGYVHAQERFFEMDVRRHVTAGRLAELFGEPALATDRVVRTLGWRRVAEREVALLQPRTRRALEAYAEGVNAYLDGDDGPGGDRRPLRTTAAQYALLQVGSLGRFDYEPEPWTPVDSLAWLKAMAWDLRGNMSDEIERALTADRLGVERTETLYPAYDGGARRPVVTQGAVVGGYFDQDAQGALGAGRPGTGVGRAAPGPGPARAARTLLANVRDGLGAVPDLLGSGDGIGSNSWVVSGRHTTTGAPLLANDPHLGVTAPGIWVQMGLHCRTVSPQCPLDVAGFTFSGVPGVVIGHNRDLAWGFTNLDPDVTDLFLEDTDGDRVRWDGGWEDLTVRTERLRVRGGETRELLVRSTRHGPIVSDVLDDAGAVVGALDGDEDAGFGGAPGTTTGPAAGVRPDAVSLAWTALKPSRTADALLGFGLARNWRQFRAAARHFAVPSQNLVYADREGHVGYQAPGLVPIRRPGNDGRYPARGWEPDEAWSGAYVPFRALPTVLDPDDGLVVTANQQVVGDEYPYVLTSDADAGYRAQRIRDLLERALARGPVDADAMARIQADSVHPAAASLVPRLFDVRLVAGPTSAARDLLRGWDGRQDVVRDGDGDDARAAAYFNAVWVNLLRDTFEELDEPLGSRFGPAPPDLRPDGGSRWVQVVGDLLEEPDDPWWDDTRTTDEVESRDDVLARAMADARAELTRLQSPRQDDWDWGDLHRLTPRDSTLGASGNPVAEWLVNPGSWEVPGGTAAVDATSSDARREERGAYAVTAAPSMRMVVSPGDWDAARWVVLGGVSGHPRSAHYADQTDLWARGGTLPWPFTADAVRGAAEDRLVLRPDDR